MSEFETIINDIQDLKKKAKNRRDLGNLEFAVKCMQEAIDKTKSFLHQNPSLSEKEANEIDTQLADCCGILGGIYRRLGLQENDPGSQKENFKLSYNCYFEGYILEKKTSLSNSYNMLNRLISIIFYDPELLKLNSEKNHEHFFLKEELHLREELKLSEEIIQSQLRTTRRRDIWALSDLALIKVLLNEEDPVTAFSNFVNEAPPTYAYNSLLSTLKPLSELDIDPKENLKKAVNYIEKKIA
jgi:hypothetical protein